VSDAPPRALRTADFDFHLPPALVAQRPAERRDESRLMIVERDGGRITHARFRDLVELVPPGDAVVLNSTRVFRARLLGRRDSGAPAEVFLLKALGDGTWEAMVSPGGKLKPGRVVHVAPGFDVEIVAVTERRTRVVRLLTALTEAEALARHGHVPLPPYIERADQPDDEERYQTVYARQEGSVAAPTAGLHFTPELLAALERRGVRRVELLLHVGAGTFKPVEVDDPAEHVMHEEWYEVGAAAAAALDATRRAGGRVWAVGTTTLRTLESIVRPDGSYAPGSGETRIFIRPPHVVRGADRLVTNFHLPRSTLLMLVAAVAGYELTMRAYQEAVAAGYRFYSYGDAMVVL
jgi:S-adenosylmethionine:tRNA ribosyltransferase-isomerase